MKKLPTSECNQWDKGILTVYEIKTKTTEGTKNIKSWDANPNSYLGILVKKSPTSTKLILEVSNKHHCKLDKNQSNYCFDHIL